MILCPGKCQYIGFQLCIYFNPSSFSFSPPILRLPARQVLQDLNTLTIRSRILQCLLLMLG